ncbi:MAG: hypothetical protein ABIJ39_03930 [Chloroflexota bacterium]
MATPKPTPNPIQEIADQISALQTKIGWLQSSVRLTSTRDAVEDLHTKVTGMEQRVAILRERGYVFEKELENQASTYVAQWKTLQPTLNAQVSSQAAGLQASLRPIETQMAQLNSAARNPAAARPLLASIGSSIDMLEDKITAAERTVRGMYDTFDNQVYQTLKHLDDIETMLKHLDEASFKLMPTEGGILAVKAVWCKIGKEQKSDPEGVLYLTDQRLIFEQKQEVAKKKVLFITTEKEKVQSLQWEIPVAMVDKVETSKLGLLKNEDHIEIRFLPGAQYEVIHLHIWADCATWQGLLNRAKAKDFDKGRAVQIDQEAAEKARAAPSQCSSCGANISQVILRGMDTITCEYCGYVIRL